MFFDNFCYVIFSRLLLQLMRLTGVDISNKVNLALVLFVLAHNPELRKRQGIDLESKTTYNRERIENFWSSYKGSMMDDLVRWGDEGRGKHRYFPGELQTSFDPGDSEWGNSSRFISGYPSHEFNSGWEAKSGELKHLSNLKKRNHRDSLSSGERRGNSLNHFSARRNGVAGPWCGIADG